MINAGKLDRLISIERASNSSTNTIGEPVLTWAEVYQAWAQVIAVSGDEVLRAGKETVTRASKFIIRHTTNLSEKDRISYDSNKWDILNIREIGRHEGLEVLAELRR